MRYKLEELADDVYLMITDEDFPLTPNIMEQIAAQEEIDRESIWYIRYNGFESSLEWRELGDDNEEVS